VCVCACMYDCVWRVLCARLRMCVCVCVCVCVRLCTSVCEGLARVTTVSTYEEYI